MRRFLFVLMLAGMLIAPAGMALAQAGSAEVSFWESVRDSKTPAELEAYLTAYPQGKFAPLARMRIKRLKGAGARADEAGKKQSDMALPAFKPREKVITVELGAQYDDPSKPMLGIRISELSEGYIAAFKTRVTRGVLVIYVSAYGAAEKAGIAAGSVILSVDGTSIPDGRTLANLIGEHAPGEKLSIKLVELAKTPADLVQILHRAADKGVIDAMYWLGVRYEKGQGIGKDRAEAVKWYEMAAEKGHSQALRVLHILSFLVTDAAKAIKRLRALGVSIPDAAAGKPDDAKSASDFGIIAEDLEKLD